MASNGHSKDSKGIPPTLPPTVEEAYRRKCIQLKQRMNDIEETNDISRVRLVRLQRIIEKSRLERSFLLEQLSKRTSTNVEDSEGSPSPPPTPKEKPLRTKRGHRKPSFLANLGDGRPGSTFIQAGPVTLSPSSDAFSHTHPDASLPPTAPPGKRPLPNSSNGRSHPPPSASPPPRRPKSPYELFCQDRRGELLIANRQGIVDGTYDVERVLAEEWQRMPADEQREYTLRWEILKKGWEAEKDTSVVGSGSAGGAVRPGGFEGEGSTPRVDDDIEMGEEGEEAPVGGGGGFTAVNRT